MEVRRRDAMIFRIELSWTISSPSFATGKIAGAAEVAASAGVGVAAAAAAFDLIEAVSAAAALASADALVVVAAWLGE